MASSLRARLNAIKQNSAQPSAQQRLGGLERYVNRSPMPEDLYSPAAEALRRIGWNGRKFDIEKCVFIDTETTGLSGGAGTVAFLVGVGYIRRGFMTVEQFFMKDYSDEPELLYRLKALMEQAECVVSFNGKTFDMPLLRSRFTMNRMKDYPEPFDLDLLPPSRRVWKLRLSSCRLANLEERVLGLAREGDLPGSEVPQRYFQYLKTGDMSLVDDIIKHNYQDIVSLGLLMDKLLTVYRDPEKQGYVQDLFSLGKALEKQGEHSRARELYRLSAVPGRALSVSALRDGGVAGQANLRLFRLCLKAGDTEGAVSTLQQMISRRQMGIIPHVELAKIYEHKLKDLRRALEHTRIALMKCEEAERESLEKREKRIREKIAKTKTTANDRKDLK